MQTSSFDTSAPAPTEALESLRSSCPSLPNEYIQFLAQSNGAEGSLGIDPGWFMLWAAEEVVSFSNAYEVPKYLPGYIAFGSNGGGELFVFPIQYAGSSPPVFMVPGIGMEPAALIQVALNFTEFAAAFGVE